MDPKADNIPDENRVDAELRTYFSTQRNGAEVPDFDVVMAKAAHQIRRETASGWSRRVRIFQRPPIPLRLATWCVGIAATAVLFMVVWLGDTRQQPGLNANQSLLAALPAELAVTEQELLADIRRTTRWQAPSDQWLAVRPGPDLFGLPDLGDPRRHQNIKEKHL